MKYFFGISALALILLWTFYLCIPKPSIAEGDFNFCQLRAVPATHITFERSIDGNTTTEIHRQWRTVQFFCDIKE